MFGDNGFSWELEEVVVSDLSSYGGGGSWVGVAQSRVSDAVNIMKNFKLGDARIPESFSGGSVNSFGIGFAFGGGYQFEIGRVRDAFRNHAWFISHGPRVGFDINIGFNQKAIRSMYDKPFTISNYQGVSSGYSLGILMGGVEFSGNRRNPNYNNADWNLHGMDYNQIGFSVFQGIDFGLAWSRTNTRFIWRK